MCSVRSLRGGKPTYDRCLFYRDRVLIDPLLCILSVRMEDQSNTISAELLSLTYGAFISQIVKDYEDITEINKQIDLLGCACTDRISGRYNMGLRLVEDYLSKTHTRGIKSFQATCQDIVSKAFLMYTGMEASVENWNSDEQSCLLRICFARESHAGFTSNPLTLYVEIPDELKGIHYSGVYCGVIRGALEMIHVFSVWRCDG